MYECECCQAVNKAYHSLQLALAHWDEDVDKFSPEQQEKIKAIKQASQVWISGGQMSDNIDSCRKSRAQLAKLFDELPRVFRDSVREDLKRVYATTSEFLGCMKGFA